MHRKDDALIVGLSGDWELEHATPRFDTLVDDGPSDPPARIVAFEATGLGAWDSSLLIFLVQAVGYCDAHELEFRDENLPDGVVRLLELARVIPEQEVGVEDVDPRLFAGLGTKALSGYEALLASVAFLGDVTESFVRWGLLRFRLRWRDFWVVVHSNSSGALPVVTLIAFLIGMIISFWERSSCAASGPATTCPTWSGTACCGRWRP